MNDLERDLKQLFDAKLRGVDASPVAPQAVLRRGHRRQVGVLVGGALGAVAVLAVVGGLAFAALHDSTNPAPVGPGPDAPFGERNAEIAGFQVHAPEGWTLLDWWAAQTFIPTTSTMCSFSATGEPVVDGVGAGASDGPVAQASPTCTSEPTTLTIGVPLFQLSTFDPGLLDLACEVEGTGDGGTLPDDGVAVLVTAFPDRMSPEAVQGKLDANCAATATVSSVVEGPTMTFATFTLAGPHADASLAQSAAAFVTAPPSLGDRDPEASTLTGPAYVLETIDGGTATWQLEAGISSNRISETYGTALYVVAVGSSDPAPVIPAPLGNVNGFQAIAGSTLSVGAASGDVASVFAGDTPATFLPWPSSLAKFEPGTDLSLGHIFWAVTEGTPSVTATLNDGTTQPVIIGVGRQPGGLASDLPGETVAEGFTVVNDDPWRVTADDTCDGKACLRESIGGSQIGFTSWNDGSPRVDQPSISITYDDEGTLVLGTVPNDVARIEIQTSDGTGAVVDTCSSVHVQGFEGLCPFAVMLPPAESLPSLNGYHASIRFLDANGSEIYPAYSGQTIG